MEIAHLLAMSAGWFMLDTVRYLLCAGVAWLLLYRLVPAGWRARKIQRGAPRQGQARGELRASLGTFAVFALNSIPVTWAINNGYVPIYYDVADYGWPYFFFTILLMIVLHDAYFYWAHRLMHVEPLYGWAHVGHHTSTNPTPWAAFAFQPLEAFIESFGYIWLLLLFPWHRGALMLFLLYMTVMNVLIHCGFELFPRGFASSRWTRWYTTATNHNLHHRLGTGNFGLYFTWWDRWMGTLVPSYEREFEKAAAREPQAPMAKLETTL